MRQEKLNEIMQLLKGDPRNRPDQILIKPIDYNNDNCEFIVHYPGKRPSENVTEDEAERLLKLYPDLIVLKIVYAKKQTSTY